MSSSKFTILIVDDDATTRKVLTLRIESQGYQVKTAHDGTLALEMINRGGIDLVLMDLNMPGMGGKELLARLRSRFSISQLPVIVLTVTEDREEVLRVLEIGANDFVVKPGDMPVLIARIKNQLTMKSMLDSVRDHHHDVQRGVLSTKAELAEKSSELHDEVHAREELQEELITTQSRFQLLYESNPALCLTLDDTGRILSVNINGARLLGYTRKELVGRPVIKTYHPKDWELIEEYLQEVLQVPNRIHRWELRHSCNDGSVLWTRETVRAVRDSKGQTSILMVCEDITANMPVESE